MIKLAIAAFAFLLVLPFAYSDSTASINIPKSTNGLYVLPDTLPLSLSSEPDAPANIPNYDPIQDEVTVAKNKPVEKPSKAAPKSPTASNGPVFGMPLQYPNGKPFALADYEKWLWPNFACDCLVKETGKKICGGDWGACRSGGNRAHKGNDIGVTKYPVTAIADGVITVSAAGDNGGYGTVIYLTHDAKYRGMFVQSRYAHLSILKVSEGKHVKKGDVIAISGNTDSINAGYHLHFEILLNAKKPDFGMEQKSNPHQIMRDVYSSAKSDSTSQPAKSTILTKSLADLLVKARKLPSATAEQAYLKTALLEAIDARSRYCFSIPVAVSQKAKETGYGTDALSKYNNKFGIECRDKTQFFQKWGGQKGVPISLEQSGKGEIGCIYFNGRPWQIFSAKDYPNPFDAYAKIVNNNWYAVKVNPPAKANCVADYKCYINALNTKPNQYAEDERQSPATAAKIAAAGYVNAYAYSIVNDYIIPNKLYEFNAEDCSLQSSGNMLPKSESR